MHPPPFWDDSIVEWHNPSWDILGWHPSWDGRQRPRMDPLQKTAGIQGWYPSQEGSSHPRMEALYNASPHPGMPKPSQNAPPITVAGGRLRDGSGRGVD